MSSKPKPPKVKPINQARIQQTEADINAQTQRINEGLTTYKTQALGQLQQQYAVQENAINAATNDARLAKANAGLLRRNTTAALGQRVAATARVNQATTQVANTNKQLTTRSAQLAGNQQAATGMLRRRVQGV